VSWRQLRRTRSTREERSLKSRLEADKFADSRGLVVRAEEVRANVVGGVGVGDILFCLLALLLV
jgi:hypothetical protein